MTDTTSPPADPEDWKTGNDPMTDAQRVYLDTLSRQAAEPAPGNNLSKAEASEKIDALRNEADIEDDNPDIDTEDEPDINPVP